MRLIAIWMALCFTVGMGTAAFAAQQGNGNILWPTEPTKPVHKAPASASLLVLCDLDCFWNLDGEPKGRLTAGQPLKVRVDLGEHLL